MNAHEMWLQECPMHKAVLIPHRVCVYRRKKVPIRCCPVCIHVARVKVRLWKQTYRRFERQSA